MNVLVTGGAGSLGREVAACLASRGHRVRAFDLPVCDFGPLEHRAQVEVVRGDIRDHDTLRRAAADVDVAIHLAALLPPASERNRQATMDVNVGGTAAMIAALAQDSPSAHLILSSSVCVYGDTTAIEPPIRASCRTQALDCYGESKVEAERLAMAGPIPSTILRISGISVPSLLEPPPVWPFTADQRLEFVCRADVVAALAACAEIGAGSGKPGRSGAPLNIAGGSTWRMPGREYVACMNEALGLPPEEARYSERPGPYDWYDTDESQALLGYQQTSFKRFLELLQGAIEQALEEHG